MNSRAMLLCLLVLSSACSAAAPEPVGPPEGWCERHLCMPAAVSFTAAGEGIYGLLAPVLERYRAATGRDDLSTDPEAGIPVQWREGIISDKPGDDGSPQELCAQTINMGSDADHWRFTQAILLDPTPPPGCPTPAVSLAHEMIHALAPTAQHVDVDSLFAASTGTAWRPIDSAALGRLCETYGCLEFNPEAP